MRRNVAGQFVTAKLINKADGTPCTTGTTTVYVTGDAGTQAAGSVGSGAATHEGNGVWSYAPAQAETNYTQVDFVFVNSNAVNAGPSIYPTAYDANGRYDVGAIGGTPQTARDIGASVLLSNGTGTGQISLTSGLVTLAGVTHTGAVIPTVTTTTTATNLTNAPTAGDFTATMKTSIGTAVAASAVASVTGNVGGNVTGSVGSVVGAVGSVTGLTASDVAAIKAKTDSLTYTVAGQVDANIQYVNDVQVQGTGASGNEWGPV